MQCFKDFPSYGVAKATGFPWLGWSLVCAWRHTPVSIFTACLWLKQSSVEEHYILQESSEDFRSQIVLRIIYLIFFLWRCGPTRAMTSLFTRFLDHTLRHTTVGRTPLNEWSVRRRDLFFTTHNTHNKQTSMPPAGFEPTISTGERP